jgi:hypothetical protein
MRGRELGIQLESLLKRIASPFEFAGLRQTDTQQVVCAGRLGVACQNFANEVRRGRKISSLDVLGSGLQRLILGLTLLCVRET